MTKPLQSRVSNGASLRRLWAQLSSRRRGQLFLVLGAMLAGAFAEVLSLGALVPFLAVMASPDKVMKVPLVQPVLISLSLGTPDRLLLALTIVFSLAVALSAAFRIALNWATNQYAFLIGHDLGMKLYERVLYQPYRWHVSRNTSETIADINKVQFVTDRMILPLMQAASAGLIGLFIVSALILVSPVVTVVAFATFGLLYYLVAYFNRRTLRAHGVVISGAQKERIQAVQEGIGGTRDVLLDGSQQIFLTRFERVDLELRDASAASNLIGATPRFVLEGVGMILIACFALYLSGSPGGFTGALPVIGAIALGAQRLLPLLQTGYQGWTRVVNNAPALEDVLDILERPLSAETKVDVQPLPFVTEFTFSNLGFRYAAELPPVLHDINLSVRKGERIGVVGKTGSGKSTFVDLLMGLLEPTSGRIEIDGVLLDDATRRAWQKQIAHVPQAIFLADASIAENIAFGVDRMQVDLERVRDAARRAELGTFIDTLPGGYDMMVGERGIRLSGGQRQRLGIARALYKNAQVLVLDEATSALDSETETAVMQSIDGLARDLTVIIIAHRITTLRGCDRILRLSEGKHSWEDVAALGLR